MFTKRVVVASLVVLLAAVSPALVANPNRTEGNLKREAAIAEFTRKMKEANYPALFEQVAQEFSVSATRTALPLVAHPLAAPNARIQWLVGVAPALLVVIFDITRESSKSSGS